MTVVTQQEHRGGVVVRLPVGMPGQVRKEFELDVVVAQVFRDGRELGGAATRWVAAILGMLRAAGRGRDAERKGAGQSPVPAIRASKQPGRSVS
ncbi:hypothetical protein [Streptomyces sp. NPDC050704]|uniref:hypothetical protein n=1 Tax=Streptomyces sp. NPDC050704 TaxID=3157219 RepID=UPI0034383E54